MREDIIDCDFHIDVWNMLKKTEYEVDVAQDKAIERHRKQYKTLS